MSVFHFMSAFYLCIIVFSCDSYFKVFSLVGMLCCVALSNVCFAAGVTNI